MKALDEYMRGLSEPKTSWTDEEIRHLVEILKSDLEDCAKTRILLYAILGQNQFGRRVRKLMREVGECECKTESTLAEMFTCTTLVEGWLKSD